MSETRKTNPDVEKTGEGEKCVHINGAGGSEEGLGQQVAWRALPSPENIGLMKTKTHEYTHFKTNTLIP